jgi:cytochrome c oxidase assembly factor CtaG
MGIFAVVCPLFLPSADHHSGSGLAWDMDLIHDLPVLFSVAAAGWWYLVASRSVSRRHPNRPWPRRYTWLFMTGLALGASVTTGPIAYGAMTSFSVHMVQHIVLMMLATPLVVMGAPVLLLLRAASPQRRRAHIVPVLRSRAFALVTNPVLSWLAFAFVLVGIHFTAAMSTLMGLGPIGHYAEYALYSGVAFCFYYTLLPGNPARNRLDPAFRVASLFLMMIPETMTGFFIYSAGFPLFPYFTLVSGASISQAVSDQQLGGALMWSTSMIIDVAWIAVAVHDWFDAEVVKTRRLDAQIQLEGLTGAPGGGS